MRESAESSLLYDEHQTKSNKIGKTRSRSDLYRIGFLIGTGVIGTLCLIAAIVLTIVGTVGLREYGFANGPFIAGIVLFGVGGSLSIVACLAAGLK